MASKLKKNTEQSNESSTWTFFTNHAHVLIALILNPESTHREIAQLVGITERAVQKIVMELAEEGFVKISKKGRKNQYKLLLNRPLRHPLEKHKTIADVVAVITPLK